MEDLIKIENSPDVIKGLKLENYIFNEDGIKRKTFDKKGNEILVVVSNTPIFINCIIKDAEANTEKISLVYYKNHEWNFIEVRKSVISSTKDIIILSEYGIHVTSSTAKELVEYLAELEHLNKIIYVEGLDRFGWQRRRVYSL